MNSDTNNNDKLAHNIGITFAVFTALVIFFCVFNMFHRDEDPSSPPINGPTGGPNPVIATVVHQSNGLDNDATSSSPYNPHQFAYSEIRARGIKGSYASACSICLAEYEEADLIRLLPSCGHLFHVKCIDPWLILHPTCPICRNSPSTNTTPQLAPAN